MSLSNLNDATAMPSAVDDVKDQPTLLVANMNFINIDAVAEKHHADSTITTQIAKTENGVVDIETEVQNSSILRFPWCRPLRTIKKFPYELRCAKITAKIITYKSSSSVLNEHTNHFDTLQTKFIRKPLCREFYHLKFPTKRTATATKFPLDINPCLHKLADSCKPTHSSKAATATTPALFPFNIKPTVENKLAHNILRFPLKCEILNSSDNFPINNTKCKATDHATLSHLINLNNLNVEKHSRAPLTVAAHSVEKCTSLKRKFPLIKKQFVKFPNTFVINIENSSLNDWRNDDSPTEQHQNMATRDNDTQIGVNDVVAPKVLLQQVSTLNLNAQIIENDFKLNETRKQQQQQQKCIALRPPQQAENNDVSGSMLLLLLPTNANTDAKNNEKVSEQQQKEIFLKISERSEENMRYENLAHKEQFEIHDDQNDDFSATTTTDNAKEHTRLAATNIVEQASKQQQQWQLRTSTTHSKRSDVRDTSLEQVKEHTQELTVPSSSSSSSSSSFSLVPINVSVPISVPVPPPVTADVFETAPLTVAPSLFEHSALPNIDFILRHADEYIVDCGDDVYIDDDILTDVIELITCNLLLTDVLKAEVQRSTTAAREAQIQSEKSVCAAEMTVINALAANNDRSDEIYSAKSEQELIDDNVVPNRDAGDRNGSAIDAMKYEIGHIKTPTVRMSDATPSTLHVREVPTTRALQSASERLAHAKTHAPDKAASASGSSARRASFARTHNEPIGRMRDEPKTYENTASAGRHLSVGRTLDAMSSVGSTGSSVGSIGSSSSATGRMGNNIFSHVKLDSAPSTTAGSLVAKDLKHTTSLDVADTVLPVRTLMRRQRRMRSQGSVEEKPEDIIERMNKLKARISGALNEVKGVLKQYSTETEADVGIEPLASTLKKVEKSELKPADAGESASNKPQVGHEPNCQKETAPVQFRFVRKIRRRSAFNEEDELKEQQDKAAEDSKNELDTKQKSMNLKEAQKTELTAESKDRIDIKSEKQINDSSHQKVETKLNGFSKDLQEPQVPNNEVKIIIEDFTPEQNAAQPSKVDKFESENLTKNAAIKLEFLNKVQEELNKKPTAVAKEAKPEQVPSEVTPQAEKPVDKETKPPIDGVKTKKKLITKPKADTRRSSIAAVEESKIEPAVPNALPLTIKAQRRPSDSETIVKKKKLISKKTTSGDEHSETAADETVKLLAKTKLSSKIKHASPKCVNAKTEPTTTITTTTATTTDEALKNIEQQQENELKVKEGIKRATTIDSTSLPPPSPPAPQPARATTIAKTNDDANDKNSNKDVVGVPFTTTKTATTATASSTITAAPKQLKIDHSDHVNAAPTSNGSEAPKVAAINASPLAASEASTRNQCFGNNLALLVGETVVVVPSAQKLPQEQIPVKDNDKTSPKAVSTLHVEATAGKEPINQAHKQPPLEQRVANATPQQVVAGVTAASTPADVDLQPQQILSVNGGDATSSSLAAAIADEATKAIAIDVATNSVATANEALTTTESEAGQTSTTAIMPELQVLTGPVQPVKIDAAANESKRNELPFNESSSHEEGHEKKKKLIIKKLVRKNSIDKSSAKDKGDVSKLNSILKDNKVSGLTANINKLTPPKKQPAKVAVKVAEQQTAESTAWNIEAAPTEDVVEEVPSPIPSPEPKKARKIKKKVIIKRQQRRLSISDSFFTQPEEEPKDPEIETIERTIAYVTDDEAQDEPEPVVEPVKPLKTCLRCRELQVGDLVMYAERYKKTLVRWKRGRVLERITSISYKLEIDDKEVPAHISYIKKFTNRKVNFGGKEYLEIDYEQVAEEERRARSYSIWNMV